MSGFQADPVGLVAEPPARIFTICSEAVPQTGITHQPLFAYEMVGICAKDHPLAGKAVWQAEDFTR